MIEAQHVRPGMVLLGLGKVRTAVTSHGWTALSAEGFRLMVPENHVVQLA